MHIGKSVVRLEPDAIGVDDAHDADRHPEHPRRHGGDPVERPIRRGVQDVIGVDGSDASVLSGRLRFQDSHTLTSDPQQRPQRRAVERLCANSQRTAPGGWIHPEG